MEKGIEKHDTTRPKQVHKAEGKPGDKPTWSSGAKTVVGTAASARSRIWYTVGQGVLNEIYFPDVDQANTKSVRFLITNGKDFFSDEEWDAEHTVTWMESGVPGVHIESRCKAGRYTLVKEIVTDPVRDTLIMRVEFREAGEQTELKLYLFVEPQMGDVGGKNNAWVGQYKGLTMLLAQRADAHLAVGFEPPALQSSCGYTGKSDGYTKLSKFEELPAANLAEKGNVAVTAEIDTKSYGGRFLVALACGGDSAEAAQQARAGLLAEFDKTRAYFVQLWKERQAEYMEVADLSGQSLDIYRVSTAVLETHQSKRFPGAFIASLSMPWGFDRSDDDTGGYHVLWPRDSVETAMGKLASGDARSARSALFYLACTQGKDGGWSQNMWLDGTQHWGAVQMDGMALPILLAAKLRQENALDGYDPGPMVHGAASFLLKHGPVTQQDRWETSPGYSTYTMATEIAALLGAAAFAEQKGDAAGAEFLRSTADAWNDAIDELTYVEGTPLAKQYGVPGYYLRIAPPKRIEKETIGSLRILMPNHHLLGKHQKAVDIVSPDALALVRFGLRAADDPRILNTVKLLDATLKRETTTGPVWTRSTNDGYGEKGDGAPFDKTGIGRGWPLLGGERGHYEIAAGNHEHALELLRTMARQTSECGMIPEQVWDAPDVPNRFLFNGHPTGSGMPLVWAHAEYIKLLRSLHSGSVWDMPEQTVERYLQEHRTADFQIWTPKQRRGWLAPDKNLRIDLDYGARISWTDSDGTHEAFTQDTGFDLHSVMVAARGEGVSGKMEFKIDPADNAKKKDSFTIRVRK
jgi:glucoamylase